MISLEEWDKFFTRLPVCSYCGELIEEENPPEDNGKFMHKKCFEKDFGEALV